MRRFFTFRSSSSSSGNGGSPPPPAAPKAPSNDKAYWEPPWESNAKVPTGEKVRDGRRKTNHAVPGTPKCCPEENSSNPQLRRSHSFSSAAFYGGTGEGNSPLSCHSQTPERYTRIKRGNRATVQQSDAVDMLDSPSSSTGCQCSSGNSPYSSPIPLRCRAAPLTKILNKNKILDLYIDEEHREINPRKDSQKHSSDTGNDGRLVESRVIPSTRRPPRAQSTAPSSPTYSKGNARTYSLREVKDISRHLYTQDWTRDDLLPTSPQKHTRRNCEKLLHVLPGKTMMKSRDSDSETTVTTEDIYEDSSNAQPILNSNVIAQNHSSDLTPYDNINGYSTEEPLGFQRQSCFLEHGSVGVKNDSSISSGPQENNTDEELYEKQKEVEQMLMLVSEEDLELEELKNSSLDELTLLQTIRNIAEDRRYLALELASQIKCRISERSSAKERLKKAKLELDIRTRRLEKEKNELQSSLEKELDRRSSSWSLKLEKFQSEEQRLRERVRELAEQNVSLQREVSLLKGNEVDTRSRIMSSEMQLNNLTASLKEVRTENQDLHHALSELQERFKGAAEERDCIKISYKEKEKEIKELQKVVVRLRRVCSEQDKTINGLRQGYSNEIGKVSIDRGDNLNRLQMEQLRLTGVEQMLRKEVESCRNEMESLRHENMCLLDRLQGTGNGYGFSSSKLDKELRVRLDCLQTQGLSLLNDNILFCGNLLGFMKHKQYEHGQEANNDFDGCSVAECTVKYQSLARRLENYKRSLQTIPKILDEKGNLAASECQPCTTEGDVSRPSKTQASEDGVELELKAETLLTTVLREKLFSKELELEQLQSDVASSVRAHDVLQTETQRLQDELSCLTHKTKDMELQMLRKDESINQLQHDLQECTKELTATCSILTKVSEERDHMWEQVKHSRETIMLLDHEVSSLKKRIEALDEDVLVKEGQIAILKDSLGDKPCDIICSPNLNEFAVEYLMK